MHHVWPLAGSSKERLGKRGGFRWWWCDDDANDDGDEEDGEEKMLGWCR